MKVGEKATLDITRSVPSFLFSFCPIRALKGASALFVMGSLLIRACAATTPMAKGKSYAVSGNNGINHREECVWMYSDDIPYGLEQSRSQTHTDCALAEVSPVIFLHEQI